VALVLTAANATKAAEVDRVCHRGALLFAESTVILLGLYAAGWTYQWRERNRASLEYTPLMASPTIQ
jgi:hypothetical protein